MYDVLPAVDFVKYIGSAPLDQQKDFYPPGKPSASFKQKYREQAMELNWPKIDMTGTIKQNILATHSADHLTTAVILRCILSENGQAHAVQLHRGNPVILYDPTKTHKPSGLPFQLGTDVATFLRDDWPQLRRGQLIVIPCTMDRMIFDWSPRRLATMRENDRLTHAVCLVIFNVRGKQRKSYQTDVDLTFVKRVLGFNVYFSHTEALFFDPMKLDEKNPRPYLVPTSLLPFVRQLGIQNHVKVLRGNQGNSVDCVARVWRFVHCMLLRRKLPDWTDKSMIQITEGLDLEKEKA